MDNAAHSFRYIFDRYDVSYYIFSSLREATIFILQNDIKRWIDDELDNLTGVRELVESEGGTQS